MKALIASALVATAALTGAASAMTGPTEGQIATIQTFAPGADLSGLSASDVNVLLSVIHGGDTGSEKRSFVQAYVQ